MRKLLLTGLAVGLLFCLAAGAGLKWQVSTLHAPALAVEMMVAPGASSGQIARKLAQHGVIGSALSFCLWLRLQQAGESLKSGMYRFEQADSITGIIKRLQQGDIMHFNVTVPEGLRNDEVLQLLSKATGLQLKRWQDALATVAQGEAEGLLLPETWQYTKPLEPAHFLRQLIHAQQKLLLGLSKDVTEQNRLRIIASIIEKETALDKERPLVSAAIHNRLKKGMPLQMDPTVIYGIYRTRGSFSGNIHRQDLSADTPWNTYTRKGLPPTPICNPGRASLVAAAAPAAVDYLYFVADGSGGHAFAATLAEHDRNVAAWVKLERQRSHAK